MILSGGELQTLPLMLIGAAGDRESRHGEPSMACAVALQVWWTRFACTTTWSRLPRLSTCTGSSEGVS